MFSFSRSRRANRGKQRGIFGFDFGFEDTDVKTNQETEREREVRESARRERSLQAQEEETRERVTTLLPGEIQTLLNQLITAGAGAGDISASATGGEVADLGRQLTDRAAGAEAAIAQDVEAIVSEARRSGERDITRTITDLSQQAGSSQNSFVQQVGLEAGNELESRLAALQGELSIRGRSAATEEFRQALTALTSAPTAGATSSNALVQLVNALRGASATEETTGETARTESEAETATRTLSEIIDQVVRGKTSEDSLDFGFGIDLIS